MRARWILVVLAFAVAAAPALADHKFGRQVRFAGIHPIPKSEGGGMCYIEGPHVHIYAANKLEYRDHHGDNVFVGDPVAYGYDGQRYAYKGPHPVYVNRMVGEDEGDEQFCYIEGPHYHYFAPPEGPEFKMVGNAYFYVGAPPQAFVQARPTYVGINAYYRPFVYERPVVEVEAPVGWVGARAEFVTPGAVVVGPHVGVVAPGVVVEGGVGVVVPPPPSVHVGVGLEIGGPAVVVHDRPGTVIVHEHDYDRHVDEGHRGEHHDNGRHEGVVRGRGHR